MHSKGFDPVAELETGLPVVQADEEALFEAVINIIDNAVKYSDTEHYLAVRSRKSGSGVCIEVEDHGVGIAPSDQGKIFDLFYRVPSLGGHDRKGTGIGLSLVKHIMNAHRGTITVASTPGKGSTFSLQFPASQT